jgi:hypothetical protein
MKSTIRIILAAMIFCGLAAASRASTPTNTPSDTPTYTPTASPTASPTATPSLTPVTGQSITNPGITVIAQKPFQISRVLINPTVDSGVTIDFYNATSSTGIVSQNLVASLTQTTTTAVKSLNLSALFTRGCIVETVGPGTPNMFVIGQFTY